MDQLRAMRTFVEVAERGAFAAAARALDLDPSAVTRQVAELEGLLGARLLVRSTRRVALTPIGQAYLQRVRTILREVDEAAALASHGQQA
ncbi:MAG: LysR family transcriptional regulator, partial [Aquincola tertiaricarbonis]